jgi:hypothetical protein
MDNFENIFWFLVWGFLNSFLHKFKLKFGLNIVLQNKILFQIFKSYAFQILSGKIIISKFA